MEKTRPNYLDYAKVITMFLVIYGHYIPFLGLKMGDNNIWHSVHIINLFHMPLFFLISGILYKDLSFKDFINKAKVQLVIPYFAIGIITMIIGMALLWYTGEFAYSKIARNIIGLFTGGDVYGYGLLYFQVPLWFCYALIIIKTLACLSLKERKFTIGGGIISVFSIFVLYKGNIFPFRLDSALVGMIFFMIGYYCKDFFYRISDFSVWQVTLIGICGLLLFALEIVFNVNIHISQVISIYALYFGKYPLLFIVGALGGILFVFMISQLLSKHKVKIICELSNGMIVVLGFQMIFFKILKIFIQPTYSFVMAISLSLIVYFLCYLVILLSGKYFPILLGNRKLS